MNKFFTVVLLLLGIYFVYTSAPLVFEDKNTVNLILGCMWVVLAGFYFIGDKLEDIKDKLK